jgi:hypothetical protein
MTRESLQIDVRHSDGKLDRVQIMGRSSVELREGMQVDTRWLQKNPNKLNVIQPTEAPAVTSQGEQ